MSSENPNHHVGLIPITFSKMMERFGFYGMRSFLVLYLIRGSVQFPQDKAMSFYGFFILALSISPILGGITGDFILGSRKTSVLGGFIQAAGCFLLAVPAVGSIYAGLFCIVLGTGLYNPNIISVLSNLYQNRRQKMDAAVVLFYIAINIGSLFGTFFLTGISEVLGYNIGFLIAGIAMLSSPMLLIFTRKIITAETTGGNEIISQKNPSGLKIAAIILCIVLVPLFWLVMQENPDVASIIVQKTGEHLQSLTLLIVPVTVIVFGILFSIIWSARVTSSLLKIGIGFLIYALSLGLMFMIVSGDSGIILFIFLVLLMQAIAELFISPVALSYICKYAPEKIRTLLISLYLMVPGLLSYCLTFLFQNPNEDGSPMAYIISIIVVFAIAAVFITLHAFSRKEDNLENKI